MYYPSSQIETNLYTNGQEYVLKNNNINYTGYYWKTSNGKFFTGKTPQDKNIQELIIITSTFSQTPSTVPNSANLALSYDAPYIGDNPNQYDETLILDYNKLNNKLAEPSKIPISFNPQLTQEDYTTGNFTRYFCKKTNELIYIEINKDTYDKLTKKSKTLLWQLYKPFKFQWVISGKKEDVFKYNETTVNFMIVKFKLTLLNQFLRNDYIKFWKE